MEISANSGSTSNPSSWYLALSLQSGAELKKAAPVAGQAREADQQGQIKARIASRKSAPKLAPGAASLPRVSTLSSMSPMIAELFENRIVKTEGELQNSNLKIHDLGRYFLIVEKQMIFQVNKF